MFRFGKRPGRVDAGYSTSAIPNKPIPPDIPTNKPPDSSLLFQLEQTFSDPLHQVVIDNVHAITCSIVQQIENKAKIEVDKPYARQFLDNNTSEQPSISTDASKLKSVQVAIPLDTIASLYPKLSKGLSTVLNNTVDLSINHLNTDSSNIECTFVDILDNNQSVRAIVDSGAPMNIISTKLVKRLGVPPDIEHKKEYGTAGPHNTTLQGAYLALPLRFGSIAVTAPAVVLPNQNYDFLIGTLFLKTYGVQTCHANNTLSILGQQLPLSYSCGTPDPPNFP